MSRWHWLVLGIFGLVFGATWIRPQWPVEQALHHSLTVLAVIALLWAQRRWRLPLSSFVLLVVFLALHTVAARWIYSFVPYDDWSEALFGTRPSDLFGWKRNHFDRLVHIAYGVCLAPVLWHLFTRDPGTRSTRKKWLAALMSVEIVLSTGALYELFEWGIALTLAPDYAEAYNGQQGDVFDPHMDMALAVAGAIVAVSVALLSRRRTRARAVQ